MSAKCPECGAPLVIKGFVDSWDADGKPVDVDEDFYCPECDVRWSKTVAPFDFYEELEKKA